MTHRQFVRSLRSLLPHRKQDALDEIEGWQAEMKRFPERDTPEGRALVQSAKLAIMTGRMPEV